ncbi:MAG: Fe-S cluster assembly sulfur transfer protein SufU [Tumebacillaceae bacterium]
MNLSDLYRQVILDHSQHPRNFGPLAGALAVRLRNPTCGDDVTLYLDVRDGVVERAHFEGVGCSISMSSASMLTEAVTGLPVADALQLNEEFRQLVKGQDVVSDRLGDLEVLAGVAQFPARIKCATLVWNALERAIAADEQGGSKHE